MNTRLALGTVQFGLPYGISNQFGQIGRSEGADILDCARASGIDTLDTAIAYGDSEQRLGEIGVTQWRVVTKLPARPDGQLAREWVQDSLLGSLARLGLPRLGGLLLHQPLALLSEQGEALYSALVELKAAGKIEKIGISIYDPAELDALCPHFDFDLVQAPLNIVDRRLISSGWLERMVRAGTEVHVRSIFLQGLLLMDDASRPAKFARWNPLWATWDGWLREHELSALQACLGFALSQPEIGRVVVGVDGLLHLRQVIAAATMATSAPSVPASLSSEDPNLINPSQWSTF